MSFDDGITQDERIIGILKKYNMPCTFFINTGLLGVRWDWVGQQIGNPDIPHLRWTEAQLKTGIYDGFDVEVHTLTHPSLAGNYGTNKAQITKEVANDAANIKRIIGTTPVGMAYPGGTLADTSDFVIETILETTGIRFARLAVNQTSPRNFALPEYWMMWRPTVSAANTSSFKFLINKFISATPTDRDLLFYAWGHGFEFDQFDNWDAFEEIIKMISEADDIVCVTNTEFYDLFKDQIPSWKNG